MNVFWSTARKCGPIGKKRCFFYPYETTKRKTKEKKERPSTGTLQKINFFKTTFTFQKWNLELYRFYQKTSQIWDNTGSPSSADLRFRRAHIFRQEKPTRWRSWIQLFIWPPGASKVVPCFHKMTLLSFQSAKPGLGVFGFSKTSTKHWRAVGSRTPIVFLLP